MDENGTKQCSELDVARDGNPGVRAPLEDNRKASEGESCPDHATFLRFLMGSPGKLELHKLQVSAPLQPR